MEQQPHEKDDTSTPFYKIHPSSLSLRQQMVELAQHSAVRTVSRNWARSLRFLQSNFSSSMFNSLPQNSLPQLGHNTSLPNTELAQLPSLKLTPRLDLATSVNYVAISYCWQRPNISWFLEQKLPHIPLALDGQSTVQYSATDVLYRAARYASHKDVQNIWIDQYCIDQQDSTDKMDGIQAMDLVYQSASHPVTLLETYIDDQAGLDAFGSLVAGYQIEADQIDALEQVLYALSEDAWFTRAWTLQEATSAGAKMMLLIACDPQFEKPSVFGSIPDEIEISTWEFLNAMVLIRNVLETFLASGTLEDEGTAISASNLADILYHYMPDIYPDDIWTPNLPYRQTCNAAEAINYLQERKNSHFPDRLAILANMCDYEIRIDARVLEMPEYAFSTCVLTLAILNGDMSLLGEYSDPDKRYYSSRDGLTHIGYKSDPHDSHSNVIGFSWGPNPKCRLRDVEYFNQHQDGFLLRPALLSDHGLTVQGILWCTTHNIAAPKTQAAFASKYREELKIQERIGTTATEFHDRIEPLVQDFFWSLLNELIESRWLDIAQTLWTYFRPRQRHSRKAVAEYSFDTVFLSPGNLDKELVIRSLKPVIMYVDPEDEDQIYDRRSLSRTIVDQVCHDGKLTCASQMGSEIPRAFFESCDQEDLVFTPLTDLGDRASSTSIFEDQAMSWKILHTGTRVEQCDLLHCLGRRRGIYRIEDLTATNFILN